jgi:PTH2 family peptidyl-tRNA hydrolase
MPPGKLAAQAGHAFLQAFVRAPPLLQAQYHADGIGTKVVLLAPDDATLLRLHSIADAAGLPTALIVDSGHVLLPHFTGAPVVTALGVGPVMDHLPGPLRRLPVL